MKKAYVILGMHRSGTSSVAGALAKLGATAPKTLMGPAEDNPKGFWESYAVSNLNDQILAAAGSYWSDWRAFPISVSELFLQDGLDVLRAEFENAQTIVLKDPRICRLYPFWRDVLRQAGYSPIIVAPVRHPAEVQASLTRRNDMAAADAIRLWLRHVLDAERFSRGQDRLWFLWVDFLADWSAQLRKLERLASVDLSLNDPEVAKRVSAFLSPDLQNHRCDVGFESPSLQHEVFSTLGAMAREGEMPALLEQLDDQRRRFDEAVNVNPLPN